MERCEEVADVVWAEGVRQVSLETVLYPHLLTQGQGQSAVIGLDLGI